MIHHLRPQGDRSGIGGDPALIIHRTGGNRDVRAQGASVRAVAHEHTFAAVQRNRAPGRVQGAVIFDVFRDQIQGPPRARLYLPVIDNLCQRRHPGELPGGTRSKIRRQRRGRGDEAAAHFDHRIRAEIKAVRIGENDRPIGVEAAKDLRRAVAADFIEHH